MPGREVEVVHHRVVRHVLIEVVAHGPRGRKEYGLRLTVMQQEWAEWAVQQLAATPVASGVE
jgi:hypothetical protein